MQALPRVLRRFPGFEINEIAGRSFARQMVEWNLPPVVFESRRHAGASPDVAAAGGVRLGAVDRSRQRRARRDYANVGAQVDLRFSVLHWYDMTLSVGYAVGFAAAKRAGNEWMVSLKIM